jgi:cell division protein FtsW
MDKPSESPGSSFALQPATFIVACAVVLTVLFSASAWMSTGPYYYVTKQVIGVALAAGLCAVVSRVNLDFARRFAWVVAGGMLFLLCLVFVPGLGREVNGSSRWLNLGPVSVQVSEFAKLGLVFCLAHYLAQNQTRIGDFRRGFLYPLAIIGAFAGLIVLEPDFGTAALVVAVGLVLLFLAGAKWRYILPTVLITAFGFAVLVIHNPNRLNRFMAYLDVEENKLGGTYQLYQALAAFAAGGTEGAGLGQGRQQLSYLPEAHTDFIFSVVGEELGLWFTLGVVILYATILVAGLLHLRRAPNLFQYLLVAGCIVLISLQAIINMGVVTGLLPTKGMSLPFLSAGLSNLLLMGMLLGVLLNSQRTWGRMPRHSRRSRLREVTA